MASTDATAIPVKNQAYRVTFPILDADGDLVTAAGSLDSEVSKDGGTFADCTNEATEIATSSGVYYLDLTATEMNADTVAIIVKSTGGKTTPIVLYPNEAGDIDVNVAQISDDATAADNAELFFDGTGYAGGTTKLQVDTVAISGDTTAADNAELDYDGTGYNKSNSTIGTCTTNTDMRGTDNAALASVLGALADAAAAGDPTASDTVVQYLKQIVNVLVGTTGVTTFPAEAAPANNVSLAEVLRAVHADVTGLNGDAMRGTDGANTTTPPTVGQIADQVWDEPTAGHTTASTMGEQMVTDVDAILTDTADMQPKLGTPAGASISADIATVDTVVDGIQTDLDNGIDGLGAIKTTADAVETDTQDIQNRLPAALVSGKMDADATAISGDTTAADRLEGLMDGVLICQVNDASATTTAFAADGFTEATDDHFNGRLITFISGALTGQQTDITDYDAAGHAQGSQAFVVTALTEAPANNDFFVIH